MRWYWKITLGFIATLVLLLNALFTWVDRAPYRETEAYQQTQSALDRHYQHRSPLQQDSLLIGWSATSLIPAKNISEIELAGYGARNPKNATGIADSVEVKTIVLTNGHQKIALVSAELLIIHPEVSQAVYAKIKKQGWSSDHIYFGATHTHSSLGAWAPGIVGDLFAGAYDEAMVDHLAQQLTNSILQAEKAASRGGYTFMEVDVPAYVINRLVRDQGIIDPKLKASLFLTEKGTAIDVSYGAHATCFNHTWTEVTGDYPGVLTDLIEESAAFEQASFRAGAVASMGAARNGSSNEPYARFIAKGIFEELTLPLNLQPSHYFTAKLDAYKLPLYLEDPQLKVSNNLRVRPWLFRQVVGEYPVDVSVASIDSLLMIGLPCDFSGELAVPLYEYARSKNLTLMINSFNGGYIGYVPDDRWYDLNKYETRTMTWYGHDMGAYLTDILRQIIDQHAL